MRYTEAITSSSQRGGHPRVALFHPCLLHGGIPRVFADLAKGLLEQGLQVDMVQATAAQANCEELVPQGVRQVDLNARRVLSSTWPLARYLRRERPMAVISGALQANVVATWARRLSRVPVRLVLTEHSILEVVMENAARVPTALRTRTTPFFARHFYPWADAVVAVSRAGAESLSAVAGIPLERIEVIYSPVVGPELYARAQAPLDHPWFGPNQPPVVLAVGRLDHFKDFPMLLHAFAELRRRRGAGAVRLLILGEGEERPALESLIGSLGIGADVALPGSVPNPLPYMRRAAVLALTSKSECFPLVLIEGLAAGAPIAATDCRFGPREILKGGEYGMLSPVGDAAAMAQTLQQVMTSPPPPAPPEALARYSRRQSIREYCRLIGVSS